jgi:AcrR family transcriptional regulator
MLLSDIGLAKASVLAHSPVMKTARQKPDRRTARTRAALMQAFIALLLDEGYDTVTVERVCEKADVGRSTFYMHFAGKDDILRDAMKNPSSVLASLVAEQYTPAQIVPQLEHFREQKARNGVFFTWPIRPIWVSCLAELIEAHLRSQRFRAREPRVPVGLIAIVIAEAQIGLIAHWLRRAGANAKTLAVAETLVATTTAMVAAGFRN